MAVEAYDTGTPALSANIPQRLRTALMSGIASLVNGQTAHIRAGRTRPGRRASALNGGSQALLAALDREEVTADERQALVALVTVDLATHGFDADYEPTDLGSRLEDIIDALNAAD